MPSYFLDTSALAKLYHRETGSEHMERLLKEPGSQSYISRLSILEIESVFATKLRTREIDQMDAEIARRVFRADLSQGRLLIGLPIQTRHYQTARSLLVRYGSEGLRTLDALQLSVALGLQQLGLIFIMIAADQRLCQVASLAGCPTVNPEKPSPLLI